MKHSNPPTNLPSEPLQHKTPSLLVAVLLSAILLLGSGIVYSLFLHVQPRSVMQTPPKAFSFAEAEQASLQELVDHFFKDDIDLRRIVETIYKDRSLLPLYDYADAQTEPKKQVFAWGLLASFQTKTELEMMMQKILDSSDAQRMLPCLLLAPRQDVLDFLVSLAMDEDNPLQESSANCLLAFSDFAIKTETDLADWWRTHRQDYVIQDTPNLWKAMSAYNADAKAVEFDEWNILQKIQAQTASRNFSPVELTCAKVITHLLQEQFAEALQLCNEASAHFDASPQLALLKLIALGDAKQKTMTAIQNNQSDLLDASPLLRAYLQSNCSRSVPIVVKHRPLKVLLQTDPQRAAWKKIITYSLRTIIERSNTSPCANPFADYLPDMILSQTSLKSAFPTSDSSESDTLFFYLLHSRHHAPPATLKPIVNYAREKFPNNIVWILIELSLNDSQPFTEQDWARVRETLNQRPLQIDINTTIEKILAHHKLNGPAKAMLAFATRNDLEIIMLRSIRRLLRRMRKSMAMSNSQKSESQWNMLHRIYQQSRAQCQSSLGKESFDQLWLSLATQANMPDYLQQEKEAILNRLNTVKRLRSACARDCSPYIPDPLVLQQYYEEQNKNAIAYMLKVVASPFDSSQKGSADED